MAQFVSVSEDGGHVFLDTSLPDLAPTPDQIIKGMHAWAQQRGLNMSDAQIAQLQGVARSRNFFTAQNNLTQLVVQLNHKYTPAPETIAQTLQTIRDQFAISGDKPDARESKLLADADWANYQSAMNRLTLLENYFIRKPAAEIEQSKQDIFAQFACAHTRMTKKLRMQIEKTVANAHQRSADRKLSDFAGLSRAIPAKEIEETAAELRTQFKLAGQDVSETGRAGYLIGVAEKRAMTYWNLDRQ